jgi:Mn2+/Fe2+ NRAMP family transporter
MLKDIISKLDYSHFDQMAIVLFGGVFIAIVLAAMWLHPEAANRFRQIPIANEPKEIKKDPSL